MKRRNLLLSGAVLCILFSASCTRESSGDGGGGKDDRRLVHIVFDASSGEDRTKTDIDGQFIKWSAADSISVFDGGESDNHIFRLTAGAGSNSAKFEGEAAASGPYWALYPYTSSASVNTSGNLISNVTVPAEQHITSGRSVDSSATLMACRTESKDSLWFINMLCYIKVTPKASCTQVIFKSLGNEYVAGTGSVSLTDTTFSVTGGGTVLTSITGTLAADNDYYLAILPGTFASGIRMEFVYDDGSRYFSEKTSSVTLSRGAVYNGGSGKDDSSFLEKLSSKMTGGETLNF